MPSETWKDAKPCANCGVSAFDAPLYMGQMRVTNNGATATRLSVAPCPRCEKIQVWVSGTGRGVTIDGLEEAKVE